MQAIPIPVPAAAAPPLPFPGERSILAVARPGDSRYEDAVALSAAQYRVHFGCVLRHRYPAYLCLLRGERMLAVCGTRRGDDRLFLEQYLDVPVSEALAGRLGEFIAPSQLVELGSFAVRKRALALPFMRALAPALRQQGYTHAVATATLPVRRCLRRLGIATTHLGPADAVRLGDGGADWGSYYSQRPAVIAGAIAAADSRLQELVAL